MPMLGNNVGIKARYLIRVDDICPTMPWDRWLQLEDLFIRNKVSPILAVIPDNQDVELHRAPARENFWDHVRSWQGRGWTIGLHGHQHLYVTKSRGIVEGCPYSEFAGLPLEAQRTKLQAAIDIFRRERVDPEVWVAPAHSFDKNTLKVLRQLGISNVSDGLHLFPCRDSDGMLWYHNNWERFGVFQSAFGRSAFIWKILYMRSQVISRGRSKLINTQSSVCLKF